MSSSMVVYPMAADEEGGLQQQLQRPRRLCFSFAAYAKTVISQLRESGVLVEEAISDEEFSIIESSLSFSFPPDLRGILLEGLPTGHGFPNWRSSSREQLKTLIRAPISGLLGEVSGGRFWCDSAWGQKPRDNAQALTMAKRIMETAPLLVPVYRSFYLPSRPMMAGNPVFFVCGGEIQRSNVDLTEFFQREEFTGEALGRTAAAWASTSPRSIDVWTLLADGTRPTAAPPLQELLEQQEWKLRKGGWTKSEAKEMLSGRASERPISTDSHGLAGRVRSLGTTLLRAGWSQEDVSYSLGYCTVNPKPSTEN